VIRVNLLGAPRRKTKRAPSVSTVDVGQRLTLACSLILVVAGLLIGWWYWSLSQQSAQLDADLASARQETQRLKAVIAEVDRFEQRRQQLQQRVTLIEQLRRGQSVPAEMLDLVSRSLPDMLWLTQLTQQGSDLTLEGRSTTLIGLSDFVGNLGRNDLFRKPIEIVDSQVEPGAVASRTGTNLDLIRFTVKASLAVPTADAPAAGTGKR
jgi:type IV pilus assembly protein PilN